MVIIVIIAGAWFGYGFIKKDATPAIAQIATTSVKQGDIEVEVSGSGTISAEHEIVKATKGGTIKTITFSKGDQVKKDQLLVTFEEDDTSDEVKQEQLNLEQKKLDLKEAKKQEKDQIKNQNIYADDSGYLTSLNVELGDEIQTNTVIGTIQDVSKKTVTVPFNGASIKSINPGQKAKVFFLDSMAEVKGTVEKVDTIGRAAAGNIVLYDVTITIEGYKAVESGAKAQISVYTADGTINAIETGEMISSSPINIIAKTSGTISKIQVKEQDKVQEGQLIIQLENDTTSFEIKRKKLELEIEQIKEKIQSYLDNQSAYEPILSPVDGEVVTSNIETGSKVNSGQEIADIVNYNELTLIIPVDELDIPKVKIGQKATITIDALPEQEFSGEVIEIAKEGVAKNGVSTFDVTIRLTRIDGIMAGMSAQANILIEQKQNILTLPIEAIQEMNGKKFVIIATDEQSEGQSESGMKPSSSNNQRSRNMKEVEVGIHDESTIEIISGLEEGEKVIIPITSTSTQSSREGFPGIGGGFGGGTRAPISDGSGGGGRR